jgi:hypothetical protein
VTWSRSLRFALLVFASSAVCAGSARADAIYVQGGYLVGGFPTGDWAEVAGAAMGLDGTNILHPDPTRPVALRSSTGWAYNFSRSASVPQANLGPNSELSLETTNNSLWFGIGPELGRAEGEARPFVFGTIGVNIYWTNSSLEGRVGGQGYSANVGHTGTTFAWSAGAGFRKSMANIPGRMIELSAEYRSGIGLKYVVPDEVTSSGTSVNWERESHNADQVLVRLGSVF